MVHKEVNSENRLILQQALNQLTPRQKEVIYLRFYHGLTNPEISGVMDINDQCVRNLLSGAIKRDRKSTRLNSSHVAISYAVFCLKKKKYLHIGEHMKEKEVRLKPRSTDFGVPEVWDFQQRYCLISDEPT